MINTTFNEENRKMHVKSYLHHQMEGYKNRPDASSKGFQRFRHRPHNNPLCSQNISMPCLRPGEFPFEAFYGIKTGSFDLIDIGCGYGDFVRNMALLHREATILGLEIRDKAAAIAQQQLLDSREERKACMNAAVLRCNAMRQLPFIVAKESVNVITIMFPDPQFKQNNERRRIVSNLLCSEYAYYLKNNGYLLTCTDLESLGQYMDEQVAENGAFRKIDIEQIDNQFIKDCLANMDRTADAERHQRKDEDKRVFKSVWQKI